MIKIRKSPTADSRTCDTTKVTKEQLLKSTYMHIKDVEKGLSFFSGLLLQAGQNHDNHKLQSIDDFYETFKDNFKDDTWWLEHKLKSRHHLAQDGYVPEKVNLVDVLEYISDCTMAGKARSGEVSDIEIDSEVLMQAFKNTCELLKNNVVVID